MRIIKKLICCALGHRYVVERVCSPTSRRVGCTRCGGRWGMNDDAMALVPWDGELEEMHCDNK